MTGLPAEGEVTKLLAMLETELESLQKTLSENLSGSNLPIYSPFQFPAIIALSNADISSQS